MKYLLQDLLAILDKENGFFIRYNGSGNEYYFEDSDDYYDNWAQVGETNKALVMFITVKADHLLIILDKD